MKKQMSVDVSMVESLGDFLKTEGIPVELTTNGDADVDVLKCEDRRESSMDTLYSGGWIACETAQALAPKLEITKLQIGRVLNFLNIKIRNCSLGCFQ